jgi:hypothetical protein
LRGWNSIWLKLDSDTQANVISCLKATRSIAPPFNNWLLFSATIEAFLCKAQADWDPMRIDYAIRQHEQWYKGDGMYGDGPSFHWDYYNSFVIQPMLHDILYADDLITNQWREYADPILTRSRRYAAVLERMIAPDGTFPPIGRSLTYRLGVFQTLAQMALVHQLPPETSPAAVRCALTAVKARVIDVDANFDPNGWLRIGLCGHQPSLGEPYISTGSLYLCLCGFLPLGLPESDRFWSDPDTSWTAHAIWSGDDLACDHAISE